MTKAAQWAGTSHAPPAASEVRVPRGSLALSLINTETVAQGKKRDRLSSPDALADWWREACAHHPDESVVEGGGEPTAWTRELLDAAQALRLVLRTLLTHVVERQAVEEEDLKPVNEILALGYTSLERTEQGHVKEIMRLRDPEKGRLLFPIALSALQLFTTSDWGRLHQCKNDRCIVFFYDTTKSGTRRWCSPGCMNRARSIHHYQLTKKGVSLH